MVGGVGEGVAAAHRQAHQHEVPQPYGLCDGVQVLLLSVGGVVAVRRPIAVAVAPLVERHDVEAVAQGQRDEVPGVARLREPVEQ